MENILVCFAVVEETKGLRIQDSGFRIQDLKVRVLVTGMGKGNARLSVEEAIRQRKPDLILTCGFAGGLNPEIARGTVVYSAPEDFPNISRLTGARQATFFCHDRIATTAEEKRKLWERTRADVVEMESGEIQKVCAEQNIPCAIVRVISDSAQENLPLDFNELLRPDMSLNLPRLIGRVLMSPSLIPKLLRLQRHTKEAARNLSEALGALLAS